MSFKHWYDPNFFIQTYDKEGPKSPGTVFPIDENRFLVTAITKNGAYSSLNRFLEEEHKGWETLPLSEIAAKVLEHLDKQRCTDASFVLCLWSKDEHTLFSCNFGLPPVQIRTKQNKRIELTQVNSFGTKNGRLLVDAIDIEHIDFLFASDSWVAYHLFKKEYLHIRFKKDLLTLLKYYGIPEYFHALDQFVLFGNQTDSDIKISHGKSLPAKLRAINAYETEFDHIISHFFDDSYRNGSAAVVFNELIMNAYEYGVLGIKPEAKQAAMNESNYFEWIQNIEADVAKTIDVVIDIYQNNTLRVTINDYGAGFDYTSIDQYITDEFDYHGRGIGMIAHMIDGLFYAKNGSEVVFFLRYDTPFWQEYSKGCLEFYKKTKLLIIGNGEYQAIVKNLHYKIAKIFLAKAETQPLRIVREERPTFIYIDDGDIGEALKISGEIKSILGDVPIILSSREYEQDDFLKAIKLNIDQLQPPAENAAQLNDAMLQTLQHRFYKEGEECFLDEADKEDVRAQNHYYKEQQHRAFEKQKLVIHDDSKQLGWMQQKLLYRPMEILSGDIYSLFKVNEDCFISYIIDSMGKGIAASVTAILSAAFINRAVILSRDHDDFELERIVKDFIGFVSPNLLEEEVLSCSFVLVDRKRHELKHVSFGMYPILLKDVHKKSFQVLKSPHPPLMNYTVPYRIETVALPLKFDLLVYSDGLCEMEDFTIAQLISLFSESQNYHDFNSRLERLLESQEQTDDITMLFVSV